MNSEERARFTCVTKNSDNVAWIINGDQDIDYFVSNIRRIESRIINEQNRSCTLELTIPAIPVNRRIEEIKCEAYITRGGFYVATSVETAQYSIQGLLQMHPNVTYSSYNATHNLIQWLEPFTLNITDIDPDIENYTVCSHQNTTKRTLIGCTNSSVPPIFLPKYSVDIFLLITAWNIVGESNNSVALHIAPCGNSSTYHSIHGKVHAINECLAIYPYMYYLLYRREICSEN